MNSFKALRLVDFVILPHANKEKYRVMFEQFTIPKFSNKYKLKILKDDEVVII